jgi:hypothetical protein
MLYHGFANFQQNSSYNVTMTNLRSSGGPIESQHMQGSDYGRFEQQQVDPREPWMPARVLVSVVPGVYMHVACDALDETQVAALAWCENGSS